MIDDSSLQIQLICTSHLHVFDISSPKTFTVKICCIDLGCAFTSKLVSNVLVVLENFMKFVFSEFKCNPFLKNVKIWSVVKRSWKGSRILCH